MKSNAFDANKIADTLAQKAFEDSLRDDYDSPFSQEARRSGYAGYIGGKSDDISVTVGRVKLVHAKPTPAEPADQAAVST